MASRTSGGSLRRWLAATSVVVGVIIGVGIGVNPGTSTINLRRAFEMSVLVPGASGAGFLDGADGIDLADADGDGRKDGVTGAEQGLRVNVHFNPGTDGGAVWNSTWPNVFLPTVNMCSVEDAIWCDVDADGALDVVAACETGAQRVEILFAPAPPNTRTELLTAANWTRVTLDASVNRRSMRAACADLEGDASLELLIGEKDAGVASSLGYYVSETPRTGASWTHVPIEAAGWIMDMDVRDLDGANGPDIIVSDKEGINTPSADNTHRGLKVFFNDGADPPAFTETWISAVEGQWKWFDVADWTGDGHADVVACRSEPPAVHEQVVYINGGNGASWTPIELPIPSGVGFCQETRFVDMDVDGALDIVTSYSNAQNAQSVTWQLRKGTALAPSFTSGAVSGILDADSDNKMDNIAIDDVDGDGDPDLVLTEQHAQPGAGDGPGLGVIGLQNPRFAFVPTVAPPSVQCTALTSGTAGAGTSAATASISPGANRLILVALVTALAGGPAAPTSVTGNGITYTQIATVPYHTSNARRITLLRGMAASPTAGAITHDFGAVSQTSYNWAVLECTGMDTSGVNGAGAIVQNATNTATASTSVTATLAALEAATSVNVAASGISINGLQTPDPDFVELTDVSTGTGTNGLMTQIGTNQTTATPGFASANAGVIAVEIRIAP